MRSLAVATIYQVFYKFLGLNQSFLKGNTLRLAHAIEREIRDAEIRKEKVKAEDQICRLAYYDGLTNLSNCNLFSDKASPCLRD